MEKKVSRRRAQRYPVHLEVKELNGQPVAGTFLLDISTLGARLESPTPLSLSNQVEFSFSLPDADAETRLTGAVVWVRPAEGKSSHYHLGVEFHRPFSFTTSGTMTRPADKMGAGEDTDIVSFFGSKGGVGTTFLTLNVAYLLAKANQGKVLVVDLDLLYGQTLYFLDAQPKYTIIDVLENFDHLDSSYLHGLLYKYHENLSLLPAPARLEEAEHVTPSHLKNILHYLKNLQAFRWIFLDCYHQMGEVALTAMESSDAIFLVTVPSFTALKNAKKLINLFNVLDLKESKLAVILNSLKKQQNLSESEVTEFLGREISYKIGFDPVHVDHSIDEGQPLGAIAPRAAGAMGLKSIANGLLKEDSSRPNTRWGWIKDLI